MFNSAETCIFSGSEY